MPPKGEKTNNKKKSVENVTFTKLHKLCDTIENDEDNTSHIINHYSKSVGSPIDYKWIIIWAPFIIYILIMFGYIYNITDVNIKDQTKSHTSEFIGGIISFFVILGARFGVDLIYQFQLCMGQPGTTTTKLIINSIYNSLGVSIAVCLGYLIALFLDNPEIDKQISVHQKSFIRNLSNHRYNMLLSSVFYIISIIYTNPITFEKKIISRNNMC